jgi:hypothetical protein
MSTKEGMNLDLKAVEKRAYEIWEREGCPMGRSDAHWAQALKEVSSEQVHAGKGETRKPAAKKAKAAATTAGAAPKTKAKAETTQKRTVGRKKS